MPGPLIPIWLDYIRSPSALVPPAAQPQPHSSPPQDCHVCLQAAGLVLAASVAQFTAFRSIQPTDLELISFTRPSWKPHGTSIDILICTRVPDLTDVAISAQTYLALRGAHIFDGSTGGIAIPTKHDTCYELMTCMSYDVFICYLAMYLQSTTTLQLI